MKPKITFILLLITLGITACAQSNTFKITGQIQDVSDDDFAVLYKVYGQLLRTYKKVPIKNGIFIIEGETDSLEIFHLRMNGDKYPMRTISIWISPNSKTEIIGKGYYINGWTINSSVAEQIEEEFYLDSIKRQQIGLDSLSVLYNHKTKKWNHLKTDSEKEKLESEVRSINKQQDSLALLAHYRIIEIMQNQPITKIWLNHLVDNTTKYAKIFNKSDYYSQDKVKLLQNLYNRLSEEQKQGEKGQLIHRYIFPMQLIQEGQPMANAELYDPQGNPHKIGEEYRGKYLLLDFWGVGCAPCIAAFPEMKEIYDAHKDKLTIISITTDTEKIWKEGLERHQLPWVNLTDYLGMEGYASRYGIRGIPFYILISPDGIVEKIWTGFGKGSLKEKLKDVL